MAPQPQSTVEAIAPKKSALRAAAGLAFVAVKSMFLTIAGFTALGFVLAAVAYYFLREEPWHGAIGAAVAFVESVATGTFLGMKRGVVLALVDGLGRLQLGRAAIQLIFQRILRLSEGDGLGERGVGAARAIERVPLAQAERWLTRAVAETVKGDAEAAGATGWIRRKIQSRLCGLLAKFTLARFRESEAVHGGVDLAKVQAELETQVDQTLIEKLRGGMKLWTILALVLLPFTVAVEVYLAMMLLHAK